MLNFMRVLLAFLALTSIQTFADENVYFEYWVPYSGGNGHYPDPESACLAIGQQLGVYVSSTQYHCNGLGIGPSVSLNGVSCPSSHTYDYDLKQCVAPPPNQCDSE